MHKPFKSLLAAGLVAAGLAVIPTTSDAASIPTGAAALRAAQFAVQTGDLNGTTCRNKKTEIMSRNIKAGPKLRQHNYLAAERVYYRSCLARHMADTVRPTKIVTTITQTTDEDCADKTWEDGYVKTRARTLVRQHGGAVTHMPGVTVKCVDAGGVLVVRAERDLTGFKAFPVHMVKGKLRHPMIVVTWGVVWRNAPDGHGSDMVMMKL